MRSSTHKCSRFDHCLGVTTFRKMASPELYRAIVYNAAKVGNIDRLGVFLNRRSADWLNVCLNGEDNEKPALVAAAREGHLEVVKFLVSMGADPSVCGTVSFDGETIQGSPPLWASAAAGHLEVTKWLVEEGGANINQTTYTNSTPLRGACYDGHLDIVMYLVENGADIEVPNRHGHTPLMIAAFRQKKDVVEYLLSKGANATLSSNKGNTALHDAAEANNPDICRLLIDAGATLKEDEYGVCPLMSAAMLGHLQVIPVLIESGPSFRLQRDALKMLGATLVDKKMDMKGATDTWRSALTLEMDDVEEAEEYEAIKLRKTDPVYEYLEIENERDLDEICEVPDAIRMQALIIRERILGGAHSEVHYYLRFRGAVYCDMGMIDKCVSLWMHALELQQKNLFPLHASTMQTFQAFQETFMIALNEHVIHAEIAGRAPLGITGQQVTDVFDKIIAEINKLADWGDKPLFEECCGEDHEHDIDGEKERLILIGLQLLLLVNRLSLPLHALASERQPQLPSIEECAAKEVPIDVDGFIMACRRARLRPLHLACECSDRSEADRFPQFYVVERLVRAGASLDAQDQNNDTPLHILLNTTRDRSSIAKLLIDNGAPLLARNSSDETCLDLIRKFMPTLQLQMKLGAHLSLLGLAANAVHRHMVEYEDLPIDMKYDMSIF